MGAVFLLMFGVALIYVSVGSDLLDYVLGVTPKKGEE